MALVLLVEDEVLIRMMVADMLEDLGHTVAGEAGDLASALSLATSGTFDVAILDVSLGSHNSKPVADALQARGIPFAFASGYASDGVPEEYRGRPLLKKPFQPNELESCLGKLLA